MSELVLDLGCGTEKARAENVIGADIHPESDADVLLDASRQLPFDDDTFDEIVCHDILEHMEDIISVIEEVWRVARPGARVEVRTPHYSSYFAYNDLTHKQMLGYFSFDFFSKGEYGKTMFADADIVPTNAEFRIREKTLVFPRLWQLLGVAVLANHYPARWEQLFAFVFRAENMRIVLSVEK